MATVIVEKGENLSKALKQFQRISAPIRRSARMHEFWMSKKEKRAIKQAKNRKYR